MTEGELLDKVKLALRVTTNAFDTELRGLIEAAKLDLNVAGVECYFERGTDPLLIRAVITYCKLYFGEPDRAEIWDRLKASYDEQKTQLSMASEYRRDP